MSQFLLSQPDTVHGYKGKIYLSYNSIEEASKVNPDSVEGLSLIGKFYGIPKEILKFKNLKYLYIAPNNRLKVSKNISNYNYRVMDSLFKKGELYGTHNSQYYNCPEIRKIPKWITKLDKLEDVFLLEVIIKNKRKFKRIYKYLPKTNIRPDLDDLKYFYKGTLFGEECCK